MYKSFCSPLARVPSAHQYHATYVLVERKSYPHAHQSVAQRYADDVTQSHVSFFSKTGGKVTQNPAIIQNATV
jgi:hypothetical protein